MRSGRDVVVEGRIKIEMSDERGIFHISFDIFQFPFVDHANGHWQLRKQTLDLKI